MPFLNNFPGARESHEFYKVFGNSNKNYACRSCGSTWERKPTHGKCAGVPIYKDWDKVPEGLYSKTALYRDYKRRLPEDALPLAAKRTDVDSFTPLYSIEQANPDWKTEKKETKTKTASKTVAKVITTSTKPDFKPFAFLDEVKNGKGE